MSCKGCNDSKSIVNKHFGLCQECNNIRLHGSKYGKTYTISNKDIKPLRTRKNKAKKSLFSNVKATPKKNIKRLAEDEAFYEECFNLSNHGSKINALSLLDLVYRQEFGTNLKRRKVVGYTYTPTILQIF